MTDRDEIIRMAQEAGFTLSRDEWGFTNRLARFARSVEANVREEFTRRPNATVDLAVAAEREACAKVCDKRITHEPGMQREDYENRQCAAAIRARGNA